MSQEACEKLLREYLELKAKTTPVAELLGPGGEYRVHEVNMADEEKLEEVQEKLVGCLHLLSDDSLIEIVLDKNIGSRAGGILDARKGVKRSKN